MICRDLAALRASRFDIAIVGGGVQGAAVAFESARRGLRTALVEQRDFGSGSSGNSLRILHGGLRYLQTLDFPRFRLSVAARRSFAGHYPQLVKPLPCLMPLYGVGAKRPAVMRVALALNDLLSADRNRALAAKVRLPPGRILNRNETLAMFPSVRPEGLRGAALWYDYRMSSSERILMEFLRSAGRQGAVVANYVEVTRFIATQGRVQGIVCRDRLSAEEFEVRSPLVINCGGAACADITSKAGFPSAFAPPSVAFNVLFDSAPFGNSAMAVAAPEADAPVHFVCPSRYGIWAGTAHVPRPTDGPPSAPSEAEVEHFVGALRRATPAFPWPESRIRKVFWGVLPVTRERSIDLTVRPEIVRHPQLSGLVSVVGIKYTTALQVAVAALRTAFEGKLPAFTPQQDRQYLSEFTDMLADGDRASMLSEPEFARLLDSMVREEAVLSTEDMLSRRTNWMFTARDPQALRDRIERHLRFSGMDHGARAGPFLQERK